MRTYITCPTCQSRLRAEGGHTWPVDVETIDRTMAEVEAMAAHNRTLPRCTVCHQRVEDADYEVGDGRCLQRALEGRT